MYEPYHYLLTKQADEFVSKLITKEKPLKDLIKEIERLKKMANEIGSLPPYAPMHYYWIDCTKLHEVTFAIHNLWGLARL